MRLITTLCQTILCSHFYHFWITALLHLLRRSPNAWLVPYLCLPTSDFQEMVWDHIINRDVEAPHVANWYFQPPKPSYAFMAASLSINRNFGEKGTVFLGRILHRHSSGNIFSYIFLFHSAISLLFHFHPGVLAAFHQVRRLVAKFSLRKTSRLLASAKNDPDTLRRWKTGDSHLSQDLACVSETLLDALSPYA